MPHTKLTLEGQLIAVIGLVLFLLGVTNIFQNSSAAGLLLLAGFILIPIGAIITVFALYRRGGL